MRDNKGVEHMGRGEKSKRAVEQEDREKNIQKVYDCGERGEAKMERGRGGNHRSEGKEMGFLLPHKSCSSLQY